MIFNKSFFKNRKVRLKEPSIDEEPEWWERILSLWVQEARAVSLWSCVAMTLRIVIGILNDFATYRDTKQLPQYMWRYMFGGNEDLPGVLQEVLMTVSVFAGWILSLMPSKIITQQAPGFIFANPIVLLWVQDKTRIIPNVPMRACDYVMGRIRLVDLATVLPVYLAVTLSLSVFLQNILPDDITPVALDPIQYADSENPWIVDFCRELFITVAFTVGLQVLPVLFQLNYLPRLPLLWLFFPVFNFAVDATGMASAFCPNVLLTFGMLGHVTPGMRIVCSLLGGMIGGKITQVYFPDDAAVAAEYR